MKTLAHELTDFLHRPDPDVRIKLLSKELYSTLELIVHVAKPTALHKVREIMWIRYATARATILSPLWRNFFSDLNREVFSTDPLLTELINKSIMDHLIETPFPAKLEARTSCTPPIELNKQEENIIRYACGYVCIHLRRRFLNSKSDKAVDFIECLDKMREQHDDTSSTTSSLDYTQEWTKRVNRGGLFIISDEAYRFLSLWSWLQELSFQTTC